MKDLQDFLYRHEIRHKDLAFMTGRSERTVHNWIYDSHPLPRSVELLLEAINDGKIDERWLAKKLKVYLKKGR